ncbi:5-deoxy-glucuronate isomerase [Allosediminivita pacifica]|uniref:5-deoxy-glucuronate isomerase n=1 Tax=Allosediminivita pacifica TaxID=1267769 RepID=UPI001984E4D5|nr:5-deoxy-glucuronate isomerase [Allosediminivita pacifica]GGB31018.1 5-deoxy-glucuronate isomerase [Allosediminivita pacifica]
MQYLIRAYDNAGQPIVDATTPEMQDVYFNLLRPAKDETVSLHAIGFELVAVVMSGQCDITVGETRFEGVGMRGDIWSGMADSVYAGTGKTLEVTALGDGVEVAVAGGACNDEFAPFRVRPDEVQSVVVGSSETKSRREICHILGQNAADRAGRLLVSELYAEDGCWSGYPPHKHDEERDGETDHAEIYHYRYDPETGFGAQFHYFDEGEADAYMTRHGDTYLLPAGYHPTVTSPGHKGYVLTILVGRNQRGLVQHFDPTHAHLQAYIPGLGGMRDMFK